MNRLISRKSWMNRLFLPGPPIQHRLPLLICVLLLCLIFSFSLISYLGVKKATLDGSGTRLNTLTEQLNSMYEFANIFLYWIVGIGVILVIIGIIIAWMINRNITNPLKKLTTGIAAIAAGDYSTYVSLDRRDELGKLAWTFNIMAAQVQKSQLDLEKKANDYKLLFKSNPMPMWIISPITLDVLDVNEAATWLYGYTRDEFLKLNSRNLRPDEEVAKYVAHMASELREQYNSGVWRHRKKDGKVIMVEIMSDEIIFKDESARIVLANDVTEKLKVQTEIARQNILQQKLITETSIEVQEREREEIGKELHDNINQILASTKLFLGHAIENQSDILPELLKKCFQNVTLAMDEIRQLSQTLVAPSLGDITLVQAIKDLVANFNSASSLNLEIKYENYDEIRIDNNRKLMLYRIIQEQINNILKHSKAINATIQIENNSTDIILTILDNGVGFDQQKKSRGIGLRNITNRAGFYNGKIKIISSPGKGCCLIVTIPITTEEKYFTINRHLQQVMENYGR